MVLRIDVPALYAALRARSNVAGCIRTGSVFDFDSLLFKRLALESLALGPQQRESVDAIVLRLPDLVGGRVPQVYHRVPEDEEIETDFRGEVQAAVYELDSEGETHRLCVDPSGIVLRDRFEPVAGEMEVVLVRLEAKPGAWPP